MPIRTFNDESNLVVDVYLKNNEIFRCCDIPTEFLGKNEKILAFWVGDSVRAYPLDQVDNFVLREMTEGEKLARQ